MLATWEDGGTGRWQRAPSGLPTGLSPPEATATCAATSPVLLPGPRCEATPEGPAASSHHG